MGVIGKYNELGYIIQDAETQEALYWAGNSRSDSKVTVPPFKGIQLKKIKQYCRQTGMIMAGERNTQFLGCEEIDNDSEE